MFGQNQIVGKKYFADALSPPGSLFVTSIFFTLQGEGPYMGQPAIFVRLAKCNLACSFCDTYFDHGEWMTFEQVKTKAEEAIKAFYGLRDQEIPERIMAPSGMNDEKNDHLGVILVITGGEPTLQMKALSEFMQQQQDYWLDIQIETNGTQSLPTDIMDYCTVVLSPKVLEASGRELHYYIPSTDNMNRASAMKFVLSADRSSVYSSIPPWALEWAQEGGEVFISPMNVYQAQPKAMKIAVMRGGIPTLAERSDVLEKVSFWEQGILDLEANRRNHEWAAEYAMLHGLRLNLQMHLYASLP